MEQSVSEENHNAYLKTQVLTANPAELRLMLLEGSVRFATRGRDALEAKDHEGVYEGFSRARDIVMELVGSLKEDQAPELCAKMKSLYLFIYQRLIEASSLRDVTIANEVIELLTYECETWKMAMAKGSTSEARQPEMVAMPQGQPSPRINLAG